MNLLATMSRTELVSKRNEVLLALKGNSVPPCKKDAMRRTFISLQKELNRRG